MLAPLADDGRSLPRHDLARRIRQVDSPRRSRRRSRRYVTRATVLGCARSRSTTSSSGWSGGGPHALACAALDAPRCRRGVVTRGRRADKRLTSTGPKGWDRRTSRSSRSRKKGGPEYEAHMEMYGDAFGATRPRTTSSNCSAACCSEPDKAAFEPEARREEFAASLRQGFEFGWRGFYDDDQAMMKEWGFDPTTITVPVAVWFGDHDLMVPRTHGEWLAAEPADGARPLLRRRRSRVARHRITSTSSPRDIEKTMRVRRDGAARRRSHRAHRQSLRCRRHVPRRARAPTRTSRASGRGRARRSSARPSTAARRTDRAVASAPRRYASPIICPTTGCAQASPWASTR